MHESKSLNYTIRTNYTKMKVFKIKKEKKLSYIFACLRNVKIKIMAI